jgi:hypothetical protein
MSDDTSAHPDPSGNTEDLPPPPEDPIEAKEAQLLRQLFNLIEVYAPHLRRSFVYSERWWERYGRLPEAHVSLTNQPTVFVNLVLTFPQMFKYLLYRGIEDILMIFNDADVVPVSDIRTLLGKANARAAPLWMDETISFTDRQAACKEILDPVIRMNTGTKAKRFRRVPRSVTRKLNRIFRRFYGEPDSLLLIGRTDERAYEVQDRYARIVAKVLGKVKPEYQSRAITRLRKVYGRGSLPLLCMSSVSGMWQLCKSSFYRRQIYLVSSPCPLCRSPY